MIPTNQDINEAAARLCGWTVALDESYREPRYFMYSPSGEKQKWSATREEIWKFPPNFCLYPVWQSHLTKAIEARRRIAWIRFTEALIVNPSRHYPAASASRALMLASPRTITICTLIACDAWPEEWEVPTDAQA